MTSMIIAYVLWFFGGWFGLHHLYLKRPYHAFTWAITCGGCFGLGLLWDICELRNYVEECQLWDRYIYDAKRGHRSPKCTLIRFTGQLIVGCWLGGLCVATVPHQWWHGNLYCVGCLIGSCGVAWGVYIVGNIGLQKRKFVPAFVTSSAICLLTLWYQENGSGLIWATCISALSCNRSAVWRKDENPPRRNIYVQHFLLYFAVWLLIAFNNGQIYYNGQMQPIHNVIWQSVENFDWNKFRNGVQLWFDYIFESRIDVVFDDFVLVLQNLFLTQTLAHPREVDEAYDTLGISRFTQMHTIRSECRKLMKSYHPDRFHTGRDKKSAEKQFVKIQRACHLLTRENS